MEIRRRALQAAPIHMYSYRRQFKHSETLCANNNNNNKNSITCVKNYTLRIHRRVHGHGLVPVTCSVMMMVMSYCNWRDHAHHCHHYWSFQHYWPWVQPHRKNVEKNANSRFVDLKKDKKNSKMTRMNVFKFSTLLSSWRHGSGYFLASWKGCWPFK